MTIINREQYSEISMAVGKEGRKSLDFILQLLDINISDPLYDGQAYQTSHGVPGLYCELGNQFWFVDENGDLETIPKAHTLELTPLVPVCDQKHHFEVSEVANMGDVRSIGYINTYAVNKVTEALTKVADFLRQYPQPDQGNVIELIRGYALRIKSFGLDEEVIPHPVTDREDEDGEAS